MAGKQRHAAEDARFVTDDFVVVGVVAVVARVETEAGDLVDAHSAHEVRTDADRAAAGDAAAALDAAVKHVDVFSKLRIHRHFLLAKVDFLFLHVDPRLHAFGHVAHPLAGVDRQVADQFEGWQRRERELGRQVLRQGAAGKTRLAVDEHRARAADAGTANEVELERRILMIADVVERDEERHGIGLFELIRLHVRDAFRILRVVAQDADLQKTVLLGRSSGSLRGLVLLIGLAHFLAAPTN